MTLRLPVIALAALVAIACTGTEDRTCGVGTSDVDGACVTLVSCGPGTLLTDGECVLAEDLEACGANTVLVGNQCVIVDTICTPPTQYDTASGLCVVTGIECGPGTELNGGFCVPACVGDFELQNAQLTGCNPSTAVQFVHAAADFDDYSFFVDGEPLEEFAEPGVGEGVSFREATPMISVPLGATVAAGRTGFPVEVSVMLPTTPETRYAAILRGRPSDANYDTSAVPSAPLTLDVEELPNDNRRFVFYHSLTDAGPLNGSVQDMDESPDGPRYFSSVAYGDAAADFASTAPGTPLDITTASDNLRWLSVQNSATPGFEDGLDDSDYVLLVATGFLTPSANRGDDGISGPALALHGFMRDGTGVELDAAARLQFVHLASGAANSLDVYFAAPQAASLGELELEDQSFASATPFQSYASGTPGRVQLTAANSGTIEEALEFAFDAAAPTRLVAIGGSGGEPLALVPVERPSERTTSLALTFLNASSVLGDIDVYITPSSDGSPDLTTPVESDLAFGEVRDRTSIVDRDYIVSITPGLSGALSTDFNVDLSPSLDDRDVLLIVVGESAGNASDLDLLVVAPTGEVTSIMGTVIP